MADKEFETIVLDYPFHRGSIVNDFLKATGLSESFRVVIVHVETLDEDAYYSTRRWPSMDPPRVEKKGGPEFFNKVVSRVGLEPLDEQTHFYWKLKGHDTLKAAVADYIENRPFNKGVS